MKKCFMYLMVFSVVLIASLKTANAQKNVISLRPINFIEGLYGISYERKFSKFLSVGIYVDGGTSKGGVVQSIIENGIKTGVNDLSGSTGVTINNLSLKTTGWGVVPEVRFYLNPLKGAPRGFFLGVYAPIRKFSYEISADGDVKASYLGYSTSQPINVTIKDDKNIFGIGAMFGHHFIIAKFISIEYFLGAAFNQGLSSGVSIDAVSKTTNQVGSTPANLDVLNSVTKVLPRFGINVGVAF